MSDAEGRRAAGSNGGVLLAFDTSGPIGSVALARDGDVVARAALTRRAEHASRLVPAIDEVLGAAEVARGDIDAIVVGEGPGSFTGVRVAAATAKGLSRALGRPLWAVSSLAAAALATDETTGVRYAVFDARAERVYGACYGVGSARVETLVEPHAAELRDLLDGDLPVAAVFCGDAAEKHRALITGAGYDVASGGLSLAEGLVGFLRRCPEVAPIGDVGSWEPSYVKASSAERLWRA